MLFHSAGFSHGVLAHRGCRNMRGPRWYRNTFGGQSSDNTITGRQTGGGPEFRQCCSANKRDGFGEWVDEVASVLIVRGALGQRFYLKLKGGRELQWRVSAEAVDIGRDGQHAERCSPAALRANGASPQWTRVSAKKRNVRACGKTRPNHDEENTPWKDRTRRRKRPSDGWSLKLRAVSSLRSNAGSGQAAHGDWPRCCGKEMNDGAA